MLFEMTLSRLSPSNSAFTRAARQPQTGLSPPSEILPSRYSSSLQLGTQDPSGTISSLARLSLLLS